MSDKPPLPNHLVLYDRPDPQLWRHLKTGDVYEIIGECFIERLGLEGYAYRRLAKDHPAIICRDKIEFMDGRFEKYGAPRTESRYREIILNDSNKVMIDDQTGEVVITTVKGGSVLLDASGGIKINAPYHYGVSDV